MKILIESPGDPSVGIPSEQVVIEIESVDKIVLAQLWDCFSEIFDNVDVTVNIKEEPNETVK